MGVMYFAFRTCGIWNKGSQEKKTPNNRGGQLPRIAWEKLKSP